MQIKINNILNVKCFGVLFIYILFLVFSSLCDVSGGRSVGRNSFQMLTISFDFIEATIFLIFQSLFFSVIFKLNSFFIFFFFLFENIINIIEIECCLLSAFHFISFKISRIRTKYFKKKKKKRKLMLSIWIIWKCSFRFTLIDRSEWRTTWAIFGSGRLN